MWTLFQFSCSCQRSWINQPATQSYKLPSAYSFAKVEFLLNTIYSMFFFPFSCWWTEEDDLLTETPAGRSGAFRRGKALGLMGTLKVLWWTPGLVREGRGTGGRPRWLCWWAVLLSITGCSINFIKALVPADIKWHAGWSNGIPEVATRPAAAFEMQIRL